MRFYHVTGFLVFIFLIVTILTLFLRDSTPRDSTDPMDSENRSGIVLNIDNLTGCHYLSTTFGGKTPRLDKEGNHICTGQENETKNKR